MPKTQTILKYLQKPGFILFLILFIFFLKELFLADIFPMFTGQDEARHYNTIQFLAEPAQKNWPIINNKNSDKNKDRLETYNFSDEIRGTAEAAGLDANREDSFTQMSFTPNSFVGQNENKINAKPWPAINSYAPIDIAGSGTLYHRIGAFIEKLFANQSILVRFYLARIYSILLGTLAVLFFYLALKNSGFSQKASLILTAIISFEPRFSIYYSAVNYDALLILAFAVFTFAGIFVLKNGPSWKNLALLFASAVLGYFNKGTGIILIAMAVFLLAYLLYQKIALKFPKKKYFLPLLLAFAGIVILFAFKNYLPLRNSGGIFGIFTSLWDYLSKTITPGKLALSSRTYWGTLSWVDSWFLGKTVNFIWIAEAVAAAGLVWFFFGKNKNPDYLPEKKFAWFMLAMVIALQAGIRLADWPHYGPSGLGAPGRYFIPNLASHIALVFVGIGMLARKKEYFEKTLVLGLILMFAFMSYLIFDVITFRFYL